MNPALVLCSHGTADPLGQETIRRTAAAVRRAACGFDVHEAVVDVEPHRLDDVLAGLQRPAVIVPLLLSRGYHLHHDIAGAAARHGESAVAAPLGPDPALALLAARRLAEAGATTDDLVVVGASGSSDPRAMADVTTAAAMLRTIWQGPVTVGHLGSYGTPAADVVNDGAASGRRVVVSSYLLAPGHFQTQLHALGADRVSEPLLSPSSEPELVRLVLQRFEAAARRLSWAPTVAP